MFQEVNIYIYHSDKAMKIEKKCLALSNMKKKRRAKIRQNLVRCEKEIWGIIGILVAASLRHNAPPKRPLGSSQVYKSM